MGKKTKLGRFRKDKFYKLAKETGFRSRAAFKLIQLNRRFGFLQQSQVCIDLCAAPGGWMQVAKQNMPVSSIVIGVDLFPIRPIPGCIGLVEDITTEKCKVSLSREIKTWKADVILHDGAPNVGKNWLYDAYQQISLTLNALKLATNFLRGGGWFVTKVFRSKDYNALLWVLKQLFKKVHATKPSASRKESAEIFVVCQGYLAPDKIDPRLLDSKYVFEELDLEEKKQSTLLHPDKQKRIKAEGYTEGDILLRNQLSVSEFMQSSSGLAALQGVSNIIIDHDGVRNHPKTSAEILECCKDLKVLGRKDVKGLLYWWKHVREDLFNKSEVEPVKEKIQPQKELTKDEIEEMEYEEIERQAADLAEEEQRELKRKRKKVLKERAKLNEKMNLKMVIKGDEGPREQLEDEIFNLKNIRTKEELEALQDVAPDVVVDFEEEDRPFMPKFKRYEKDSQHLDDDGLVGTEENNEEENESKSESDFDKEGLGLSDDSDQENHAKRKKKKQKQEHPLIKPCDYRDKDTRRKQRVQLWFEKENLQNVDSEDEEDYDLDRLADEYKSKGVEVLGEKKDIKVNTNFELPLGKRAKRKAKYVTEKDSSSCDSSNSDEEFDDDKALKNEKKGNSSEASKSKKIRLNEDELALGAMIVKSRKMKRDLIDSAWNRYTFNDEGLPQWFVQDEEQHMRRRIPVPKELAEEYQSRVQALNARPIKKVMEAKARKKRRAMKRLTKAKKKAEKVLENADASAQEKVRQIKKLYKNAEDKKKEIAYVVAKKHLTGKRARRPPGVKGRFKVVDPRMKKDKRALKAKEKKSKGKKK